MGEPKLTEAQKQTLGRKLDAVGFYATANDIRNGRIGVARAVYYLRRDAPGREAENAKACIALADELDRGREVFADA